MNLDQHFVTDREVLLRVVKLAKIQKDETILEVGAGTGNLTKLLVEKAKKVYAVEKDKKLFLELKKIKNKKLKPILANALELNLSKFDKIVANIPYSISEPLIQKLIYEDFKLAVLLLPEGFVKIISEKKTKFSLISKLFFKIELDREVFPESFYPKPKVLSRIILLRPKIPKKEELIFREFIKQKDKKAKNALREAVIKGSSGKNITKRKARDFLKDFKINKKVASLSLKELEKVKELTDSLNF
jgi:16S rRNA (adenine1518-N6/adenine1519-N6)-dimethyltransferase